MSDHDLNKIVDEAIAKRLNDMGFIVGRADGKPIASYGGPEPIALQEPRRDRVSISEGGSMSPEDYDRGNSAMGSARGNPSARVPDDNPNYVHLTTADGRLIAVQAPAGTTWHKPRAVPGVGPIGPDGKPLLQTIAELRAELAMARDLGQRLHRRTQALEGPWQSRVFAVECENGWIRKELERERMRLRVATSALKNILEMIQRTTTVPDIAKFVHEAIKRIREQP